MKDLREAAASIIDLYIEESRRPRPQPSGKMARMRKAKEILGGHTLVDPEAYKTMGRAEKTRARSMAVDPKRAEAGGSPKRTYRGIHPVAAVANFIDTCRDNAYEEDKDKMFERNNYSIKKNKDGSIERAVFFTPSREYEVDDDFMFPRNARRGNYPHSWDEFEVPKYSHRVEISGNGNWHITRDSDKEDGNRVIASGDHRNVHVLIDHMDAISNHHHPDHSYHHDDMYIPGNI